MLLDAHYEEVVKYDAHESNDAFNLIQIECRKVQALTSLGRLDEAEELIAGLTRTIDTLSSNKEMAVGLIKTSQGILLLNKGRNDLAMESLELAVKAFEQAGLYASLDAATAIATLGIVFNVTGKTEQAEEQLLKALSIRKSLLTENHELIGATLNDLGLVYTKLDPEKAIDYYEKALEVYQNIHDAHHPKIAISNTNLGVAYREIGFYGDAVNHLESALKVWESIYIQPHPTRAFVLSNLGQTYLKMGDSEAALAYYMRALKIYQESYGDKHPDIASTFNAIGNIKISQRLYDEGLLLYQQAIQANVKDFNTLNPHALSPVEGFYNGNVLFFSLLFKAEALEARYYAKTLKFKDLLLSLNTIQQCDTLIDKLRQQINNEGDKIALGSMANDVYAHGVRVAHALAENAWRKKEYSELAFYFAEKSKSAVLLDAISDANAKSFAGIPDQMLEEEKYLNALKAYCNQQLAQKPCQEEEQSLRDILFKVNRDYEQFVKNLEAKFPAYYNLKFNQTIPNVKEIQGRLNEKKCLISYFIDERNNMLYTFVITRSRYKIYTKTIPPDFDKLITGLRNSLYFNEIKSYKITAGKLGDLFLPPVEKNISELVIIPVGRMAVVPFEALLTRSVKTEDYAQLPYLLFRHSISYEFSAGLIAQEKPSTASGNSAPAILLCAPVEFSADSNLPMLPGTKDEVNAIAELFEKQNLKSKILLNEHAVEDQVKSSAIGQYRYLHFATHGLVNEDQPALSRILLNPSGQEDGSLFSGEIYNLQLDADLVTLSACETGLGKLSKGEGVIGISRALVYAGAKRIVVSLWSVADASTSQMMAHFYERLVASERPNFAEALRASKVKMIREKDYPEPHYWAPFILLGF